MAPHSAHARTHTSSLPRTTWLSGVSPSACFDVCVVVSLEKNARICLRRWDVLGAVQSLSLRSNLMTFFFFDWQLCSQMRVLLSFELTTRSFRMTPLTKIVDILSVWTYRVRAVFHFRHGLRQKEKPLLLSSEVPSIFLSFHSFFALCVSFLPGVAANQVSFLLRNFTPNSV